MRCARCDKEFPDTELKPPPLWLRVAVLPILYAFGVVKEGFSGYCYPCRRSLNAALFFVLFLIVLMGLVYAVSELIPPEVRHGK
jgi:hypothetical protein